MSLLGHDTLGDVLLADGVQKVQKQGFLRVGALGVRQEEGLGVELEGHLEGGYSLGVSR